MSSGSVEDQMKSFWMHQQNLIEDIDPETTDFKVHSLPLARIKKVMKLDDAGVKFISHDAPLVFARGMISSFL
jgi:nuclear transcription factor Y, gamma|tara:strand:- start:557 stop:775 length:219 start_codon:yes stop_codon:yes gene_type:complete